MTAASIAPSTSPVHVVIGASGGIGRALCRRLTTGSSPAEPCSRLVLAARHAEPLEELAAELNGVAHPLDARDPDAVAALLKDVVRSHGRVDGVVNLAGSLLLKSAHATSPQDWQDVIDQNLTTAFATVRAAGMTMRRTGGSVVLMSSAAAAIGLANHEAIAAAKAGVEGITRAAAASYAARGIRFNAVAPGLTRTSLAGRLLAGAEAEAASAALHPLGRIGEPDEVARVIQWLLRAESSWVTGQVFRVDGGLSSVRPAVRR